MENIFEQFTFVHKFEPTPLLDAVDKTSVCISLLWDSDDKLDHTIDVGGKLTDNIGIGERFGVLLLTAVVSVMQIRKLNYCVARFTAPLE